MYVNLENLGRILNIKRQESSYQIPVLRDNHLVIISFQSFLYVFLKKHIRANVYEISYPAFLLEQPLVSHSNLIFA